MTVFKPASAKGAGLSEDVFYKIDALLANEIASGQLPGAVSLLIHRGQVLHRSAQGLANIEGRTPLNANAIFAIFSMTKPITAAAMMVLFERGLWSLDDPIFRHLPEFADVLGPGGQTPLHPPTMGELMTHTAGLGYGVGPGPHDAVDKAYIAAGVWGAQSLAEFSTRIASVPLAYEPGAQWRYSLAADLQGAIIERLTGQSLPDFMREALFEPLGMADTDFFVAPKSRPRLASVYHMYGAAKLTPLDHPQFRRDGAAIPVLTSAGGGLFSTADDYGRFAQMLLQKGAFGGVEVLQPASVELMTRNRLTSALLGGGFGVGVHRIRPGYGYGFNGAVIYDPALAGARTGRGAYLWDGAAGTWFWVDPDNEIVFVGMIQRMLQDGMAPYQEMTQAIIADGLSRGI